MSNEINILMNTGMTKADAERHLRNGATVYKVNEYLKFFDEYTESFDDDDKVKLRTFLEAGEDGSIWDNDLTTCDGVQYYIEYCL